jgi:uncharacterized repeat protein (TIGR04138 family)
VQLDPALEERIYEIAEASGRFRPSAFFLVLQSLEVAQIARGRPGHVRGRELLEAFRTVARRLYGPMALTVLQHMGLYRTEDVGEIVFLLVEEGILKKREEDTMEDFRDVFRFEEAFRYQW